MILSDEGIRRALRDGEIEIDPPPAADQYSTSAVDIFLGDTFRIWNRAVFDVPGVRIELDLVQQTYGRTAAQYLIEAPRERDRSIIVPPNAVLPQVLLCQTRV